MIPVVRTDQILVQEVGDQLIIYDQKSHSSHCLNRIAARVWHYCNGHNTVEDIAKLLEKELELSPNQTSEFCVAKGNVNAEVLVWQALEEFERYQLLQEYIQTGAASLSRRKALKTAAIGGGVALGALFPMIRSIVVPTPAMAKSGGGKPRRKKDDDKPRRKKDDDKPRRKKDDDKPRGKKGGGKDRRKKDDSD